MPFYSVTKYRLHPAHADYTVCPTRSPSLDKAPGAGTRNFIYIDIYTHRYIYIHKKKKKKFPCSSQFKAMYREQPWPVFKCLLAGIFTFINKRGHMDFKTRSL